MADLTACYFCGAIDGPLSAQPVVPEALAPDPDEQRTIDVCTSCGEKLSTLQGIVVRATAGDGDGAATEADTDGDGEADAGAAESPVDGRAVDESPADEPAVDERAVDESPADEPAVDERAVDEPAVGPGTDRSDESDRGEADHGPVEWPTIDDGNAEDGAVDMASDGPDGATSDGTDYSDGYRAGDRDRGDDPVETDDDDGAVELPDGTRQVVRLLQNREFPVVRAEIETVAENAYDLEPGQAHRAVDALVENGALVEEAGTLHRPQDRDEDPG